MTDNEDPPNAEPLTLAGLVEGFAPAHTQEQVERFVKALGIEGCRDMLEAHLALANHRERHPDEAPVSELVEAFERQFSQEEAEQILESFRGDVRRASQLYKELTDGYASTLTVEALIEAGKV